MQSAAGDLDISLFECHLMCNCVYHVIPTTLITNKAKKGKCYVLFATFIYISYAFYVC